MRYNFNFESVENFIYDCCDSLKFICEYFKLSYPDKVISRTENEFCESELSEYQIQDETFIKDTCFFVFYGEYPTDIAKTVDSIFLQLNPEQRNILAIKIIRRFIPILYCKHFKVSDFLLAAVSVLEKTGTYPYYSVAGTNKIIYAREMFILFCGWKFLCELYTIFIDYDIDIKKILDKSLSKVIYQYLMYEYPDLLPDGLPDIASLDWRMFGLRETEDADLCNNTQGETRKASAGATTRVQCDVLTALLRAGDFNIPDNKSFASFISWLCGGTSNNIRQRGFYGNLSDENINSIKEKCSLIGLKYEKGKITQG